MTAKPSSPEQGFTLIELLVVIAIIVLVGAIGLTAFQTYKASAAFAAVAQTMADARRTLEAGIVNFDNPPGAVSATQSAKGELSDAAAHVLMPGFFLSGNMKIEIGYDPACPDMGCEQAFLEVWHCQSSIKHQRWSRDGSGLDILIDVPGGGC